MPVHARDDDRVVIGEPAAQQFGGACLASEVQFAAGPVRELVDGIDRAEPSRPRAAPFQPPRQQPQQGQVRLDLAGHAGTLHLHRHRRAVGESRPVHLRQGGGRERLRLDHGEHPIQRLVQLLGEDLQCRGGRGRRHIPVENAQGLGILGRHVVGPQGQHLARLDERGAQLPQHQAQPLRQGPVHRRVERTRPPPDGACGPASQRHARPQTERVDQPPEPTRPQHRRDLGHTGEAGDEASCPARDRHRAQRRAGTAVGTAACSVAPGRGRRVRTHDSYLLDPAEVRSSLPRRDARLA